MTNLYNLARAVYPDCDWMEYDNGVWLVAPEGAVSVEFNPSLTGTDEQRLQMLGVLLWLTRKFAYTLASTVGKEYEKCRIELIGKEFYIAEGDTPCLLELAAGLVEQPK